MIRVAVEIREGALTHRTQVTAPSIERALKIAGGEKTWLQGAPRLPDRARGFLRHRSSRPKGGSLREDRSMNNDPERRQRWVP